MNQKSKIKKRLKSYLESLMFEPMEEQLYKNIANRTKKILMEEEYEFNDVTVTYVMTPGKSDQLVIHIKGKWENIQVTVGYQGRFQYGDIVSNWAEDLK